MNDKEYLTQEKFDEFKKELELLKTTKRKEVAEQLEYAKSLGDLSENAEYHEARDAQAVTEDRIAKLESILKNTSIVNSHDTNTVNIGSVISLSKDGIKKVFTIVGTEEADVLVGKISIKSPLGSASLGKKKGDQISYDAPSGKVVYTLVDIS